METSRSSTTSLYTVNGRKAAAPETGGVEVQVCRAARGCPNAVGNVAQAEEVLRSALEEADAAGIVRRKAGDTGARPLLTHHRLKVSVSGCPNSCSQPQIADFGLSAQMRPELDSDLCIECGACADACREGALSLGEGGLTLHPEDCVACGACIRACPTGALTPLASGWRVMAGGRLGRHPRLAHEIAECASLEQAAGLLAALLRVWEGQGRDGERIGALLERLAGEGPVADVVVEEGSGP